MKKIINYKDFVKNKKNDIELKNPFDIENDDIVSIIPNFTKY